MGHIGMRLAVFELCLTDVMVFLVEIGESVVISYKFVFILLL